MFDRSLLLVSGKGGVGKSAVAAALGILAARRGLSVLTISMVDDLGLAAHLGVDRLSYTAQEIRPGVHALTIERSRALDEYIRLQLHAPRIAPLGPVARGLSALADTVPGAVHTAVPQAAHICNIQNPPGYNQVLGKFLRLQI